MRTPLELARALGWPEPRRAEPNRDPSTFDVPPPAPAGTPVPPIRLYELPPPPPVKLTVWRARPGRWLWVIGRRVNRTGIVWTEGATGSAPSQPAALALGLAALDTATHRAIHSGGWETPA